MNYFVYIFLGLAPSLVWLAFYLRKDAHPEPKTKVIKVFGWGALATLPAFLIERGLGELIKKGLGSSFLFEIVYVFLVIALLEEALKYLVVRGEILKDREFDEPLDAMLYMVIAALGFAASENIFFLWPLSSFPILETLTITFLRFLGATFLHALSSGLVGFFLAFSFFETEKRNELITLGLGIATLLHGLYNFSIMRIPGSIRFIAPIIILAGLAFSVSRGFKKLKTHC